jgi:hypothetical protein
MLLSMLNPWHPCGDLAFALLSASSTSTLSSPTLTLKSWPRPPYCVNFDATDAMIGVMIPQTANVYRFVRQGAAPVVYPPITQATTPPGRATVVFRRQLVVETVAPRTLTA